MAKYVCSICGYTHEGNKAPGRCPLCKSPSSQFAFVEEADEIEAQNAEKATGAIDESCIDQSELPTQDSIKDQNSTIDTVVKNVNNEEDIRSTSTSGSALCSEDDEKIILSYGPAILQAVKWYQEKYSCGLKEAKDVVEYVFEKQKKTATGNDSFIYGESVASNEDSHNQGNRKTFLIIIGVVVLLFLVGLLSNNSSQSEQDNVVVNNDSIVSADPVEIDIKSAEYVTEYLEETINQAIHEDLKRALAKYFTKDFVSLYMKVDEIDNKNSEEIGFWDSDFWTGWQDGDIQSAKVLEIKNMTGNNATVMVQLLVKIGEYDESKISKEVKLVYEGDSWRIDDYDNYQRQFDNYIEASEKQQIEEIESINEVVDTCAVAE